VELSARSFADILVATPTGRIDFESAAQFGAALQPVLDPAHGDTSGLLVDLAGVDYISSIGLRVLMDAAKQMRGRGRSIAVAGLQPVVAEIFAISRFHKVIEVFPTVRDALAKLSAPALAAFDAHTLASRP
jgi:anti-anti-sigma factor